MGQTQIHDRLRAYLAGDLLKRRGIAAVYLFGSVARGTARSDSDVDLAVLFETDPPRTLEGLAGDLADEFEGVLGKRVDLVILNRAPVDLIKRVLRDGDLLVDPNPSRRIQFEVRARNEFFDLEPFLKRYRRSGTTTP